MLCMVVSGLGPMKCVRVYDDFSIPKLTSSMQTEARQKLKEALQSSSPPTGHLRFYIAASIDHSHSQICEMNMRIHPPLLKETEKIVKSGVTSTREIRFHLKWFVNMFWEVCSECNK